MSGKKGKPQQQQQPKQKQQQRKYQHTMKDGTVLDLLDVTPLQVALDEVNAKEGLVPRNNLVNEIKEHINKERKELLKQAFKDYEDTLNKLKGIKPDVEHFDKEDQSLGMVYSKDMAQKKRDTLKQFENLKDAIEEAWSSGNFEPLEKIYGKKYDK